MPQIGRASTAAVTKPDFPVSRAVASKLPTANRVLAEGKLFDANAVDIDKEFDDQEGVFLPEGHDIEDLGEDAQALTAFQSFTIAEKKSKPQAIIAACEVEDAQQLLAQRRAALQNPNKKPGIKKRTVGTD